MIVVLRAVDKAHMAAALTTLGFTVNEFSRDEEFAGTCSTPPLYSTTGMSISLMLNDEQAKLLPDIIDPPDMLCDYRSDEEGAEWPVYTVNGVDINGNPVSYQQAAGGFA